MSKTKTSTFGVSKREGHDASSFYNRNLYNEIFSKPVSKRELKNIVVPPVGDWADKIYCHTSTDMNMIPDNSTALVFTSPPYNVGKDYDDDVSLEEYLELIEDVAKEVYRVLRPGGRYVINIANLGRKPYIPLHAFFYQVHLHLGFLSMGEIIWVKAEGASGNCAWGSWRNGKAPRLRDVHEYLLVFAKHAFERPDRGESDISSTEFMDATLSVWNTIPPESAKRVQHPAPFSVQLAERVIKLYSYVDDVVLDPFVGSGSTCVAANLCGRHYVGFDISPEYCEIAETRVQNKGRLYMASEKTECTELAVGFGILDISEPLELSEQEITSYFEESLSPEKYSRFKEEFVRPTNSRLYSKLLTLGHELRSQYPLFQSVTSICWCGPDRQARTDSGARDLIAANTPISVKAGSNVLLNKSPAYIFESLPQGLPAPDRSENWFLLMAPSAYQALYSFVRSIRLARFDFLDSVDEFERVASKREREELKDEISKLVDGEEEKFNELYLEMCKTVATASADKFNNNFSAAMRGPSPKWIIENITRVLFRIDSVEYIMAGTDGSRKYAIKMPALSQWKKEWEIVDVEATPDLRKGQSIVNLNVQFKRKKEVEIYTAQFPVQIRWSHGKFAQNPEAKVYKDFSWSQIPFVETIVK
ncbi:MAG: site-specific DNA-methyltransferase [Chloroflexota bacterium]